MKHAFWCALVVVAGVLPVAGQAIKIPENWEKLAAKADEATNLTLDKSMLAMGAKFMHDDSSDKDNAAVQKLLSKLSGIYVRNLEFKKEGEFSDADVAPIRAQLQGPEWSRIIDVNEKSEKEIVEVYVRQIGGQYRGIVILAQEPTELTFVHIDGPIDPDDLAELSGNFGIPQAVGAAARANSADAKAKGSADVKK